MININDINEVNLISWIVLGLLVGVVAQAIDSGKVRGGIVGSLITGLVGAVLGGILANVLLGISVTGMNANSILIAVAGALILVGLQRILFRRTERIKTESRNLR